MVKEVAAAVAVAVAAGTASGDDHEPTAAPVLLPPEVIAAVLCRIRASCSFEGGVQQHRQTQKEEEEGGKGDDQQPRPAEAESGAERTRSLKAIVDGSEGAVAGLSLPLLSLVHRKTAEGRSDRKQVEDFAASLLGRRLVYRCPSSSGDAGSRSSSKGGGGGDSEGPFRSSSLDLLPAQLLENVTESFATLVSCRLRAYATFLARHGISLAESRAGSGNDDPEDAAANAECVFSIEQKLNKLLEIGGSVTARSLQLEFEVHHPNDDDVLLEGDQAGVMLDDDGDEGDRVEEAGAMTIPVTLNVRMEVEIPTASATAPGAAPSKACASNGDHHHQQPKHQEKKILPLLIAARGEAKGELLAASKHHMIHVEVDTRKLLSMMILQASSVVAAVVDEANTSSIIPESRLCRSSSFLAMPPPPPQKENGINASCGSNHLASSDHKEGAEDDGDMLSRAVARSNPRLKMHGLDILSTAAEKATDVGEDGPVPIVVSPDIRGKKISSLLHHPPGFNLDFVQEEAGSATSSITASEDNLQQQDLSELSPDQCAVIVDCVFGGGGADDDQIPSDDLPPAAKRLKTTSAST